MSSRIGIRFNTGKVTDRHTGTSMKIIQKISRRTPDFKHSTLFQRFYPSFQDYSGSITEKESSCSKVGPLFEGRTVPAVPVGIIFIVVVMPGYFGAVRAGIKHDKP
jgi:hypothetical protein